MPWYPLGWVGEHRVERQGKRKRSESRDRESVSKIDLGRCNFGTTQLQPPPPPHNGHRQLLEGLACCGCWVASHECWHYASSRHPDQTRSGTSTEKLSTQVVYSSMGSRARLIMLLRFGFIVVKGTCWVNETWLNILLIFVMSGCYVRWRSGFIRVVCYLPKGELMYMGAHVLPVHCRCWDGSYVFVNALSCALCPVFGLILIIIDIHNTSAVYNKYTKW